MIAYVLTDGEYSDYHILGVYSTKDNAESAALLFNITNPPEEWEIDAPAGPGDGMLPWCVKMDVDGRGCAERESAQYFEGFLADGWRPYGDGVSVAFYMWAHDAKHATKIANERRAQLIASGEWDTNWDNWRMRAKGL